MTVKTAAFSHQDKFSSYMAVVLEALGPAAPGERALDLPAGTGLLGDRLREQGYEVVSADINRERPDFVFADLNEPLPFDDAEFDVVTCLEGIEHVLNPFRLIGELARVTRPGGRIVLSTPNILNLYSRVQFLFTGTFFLFNPAREVRAAPGEMIDRGHISPLGYAQIRYLADYFGVDVIDVKTDRYKKKVLFGLYPLVALPGRLWGRRMFFGKETNGDLERNRRIYRHLFSPSVVFGRTLVVVMEKREEEASVPRAERRPVSS